MTTFDALDESELGLEPTDPPSLEHTFTASIPEQVRAISSYTDAKDRFQSISDSPVRGMPYTALSDATIRWRCFFCTDMGISPNYAKAQSDVVDHFMVKHGKTEEQAMLMRFGI